MTPGSLWYNVQRDWKRGFSAAWNDRVVSRRILNWRNPHADLPHEEIPIHVLTGSDDWLLACWMLASFFHFTGRNWRVFIHDDGRLPPEASPAFVHMFPGVRGVSAHEADRTVLDALADYPACREYRLAHPLARKIFDIPTLTRAERFIILDSDLIFFRKPEAILRWCDHGKGQSWFNKDAREAMPIPRSEVRERLGIDAWHCVNSGLCLIDRAVIDFALCERALRKTRLLQKHIWLVEQSLFAICASAVGRGGLLPADYEVSLKPNAAPGIVARHYVGAVRQRFYGEGIPMVKKALLGNHRPAS
jgi:hypothetical protein